MKPKYNTVRFRTLFSGATSAIVVCFGASVSQGATNLWTGTTDKQWNTTTNWSLGHIPEKAVLDEDAVINTSTGNLATIEGANLLKTPRDIIVGDAATGILNHVSGDALTGAGNWLKVGLNGGTGTYNLANTNTVAGGISGFLQGSGNMVVSGEIQIGQGSGSTGTLNMNTAGLLSSGGAFFVGFVGITSGSGLLNMESGTLNVGGNFNVSDGGIINVSNTWSTTTTGTMNMTGGTVSSNGEFRVGNARGKGILNFSAGAINTKNWTSIGRSGGHGTVNMTGGTWTKTGGGDFTVGDGYQGAAKGEFYVSGSSVITSNNLFFVGNSGSKATMSVAGTASVTTSDQFFVGNGGSTEGTLDISDSGSITNNNWIVIGRQGGKGTVNMSGGTWKKNATDSNFIIGSNTGSVGLLAMTGGTVTVPDSGPIDRGITWLGENDNSKGTLTMSGTAQFNTERFVLGNSGTAIGTMNLNGGNIATAHILGGNATANVYFNGTQITATAGSNDFIQNLDLAEIQGGGLRVDSQAFNLISAQVFTGPGGVVKSGIGTLTLTGASNHAGPTSVLEGKLLTTTASDATGAITLSDFTGFGLTQTIIDEVYNTSAVTFGFNDNTLDFNLGNFAGNTTVAPLNVTGPAGPLTLNGDVIVNIADTNIVATPGTPPPIPLISYTGLKAGSGNFVKGTLPDGVIADLVLTDTAGASSLALNVIRANDPYWTGTTNNLWNTADANWKNEFGGVATNYADGDPAMFDDRVDTGPTTIALNGPVAPGGSGVTFNNTTKSYTLGGSGKITGSTGLLKLGTGTVDLGILLHEYTGATTITAGTINVGALADAGAPSPIGSGDLVLNGGTLNYTGTPGGPIARGFNITAANSGITTLNDLTLTGPVIGSGGSLTKLGAGNLTLTSDTVSLGGPATKVNAGTLSLVGSGSQVVSTTADLWVGAATTTSGNLVLQNTTLNVGAWVALGRGNGNTGLVSTITATGSTIQCTNLSTGFNGDLPTNDSDQIITLTNTAWTTTQKSLLGESQNALTDMTLSGTSSYTASGQFQMALNASAACNIIIQGSSSMSNHVGWFSIGDRGTAVLTVKGNGSLNTTGIDLNVTDNASSKGTLKIQENATVTAGTFFWGKGAGTIAVVEISGGTFNGGISEIAQNGTSNATITQTGGIANFGNNDRMWFAQSGKATWNQSAGEANCNGWLVIGRGTGSIGEWNVTGGILRQTTAGQGLILAEQGSGTLNIATGGVVDAAGGQVDIATSGGNGTLSLKTGGTLRAREVVEHNSGTSTMNFDGGTLVANSPVKPDFIHGIDTATITALGGTIDSNGQDFIVSQSFQGPGNLVKTGLGTVAMDGVSLFAGSTTVSAGALGGTGSLTGPLVISPGATLAPGHSVGIFTAGATTISGTYACEVSGSTADKLVANGTLDVSSATLAITQVTPASGLPLIIATYTGATPAPFATVTGLPSGYSVVYNYGGNQIALVGAATPYSSWAQTNITAINPGADATMGGDPDGDGSKNIAEFALNGNPLSGASSGKVVGKVASVGGSPTLVLTLPVRTGATFSGTTEQVSSLIDGVVYKVQGSDELATWNLAISEVTGGDKTTIESTLPAPDTGWTYRTFQSPGTTTADPADFLRAIITAP